MEELDGLAQSLDTPLVTRAEAGAVIVPDTVRVLSQSDLPVARLTPNIPGERYIFFPSQPQLSHLPSQSSFPLN